MKDLHSHIKVVSLLDPVVVSATGNVADIDLAGYNSAEILIALGTEAGGQTLGASHNLAFKLEHADDNGAGAAGSYAAVEAKDILGFTPSSGVFFTLDDAAKDNAIYKAGYVGGKRFLKITYTETGTVSVPMGLTLVKGHPLDGPVA